MVSLDEIRDLLVEACGSPEAGEPGVDLLERGLLDSLALITLLEKAKDASPEKPAPPSPCKIQKRSICQFSTRRAKKTLSLFVFFVLLLCTLPKVDLFRSVFFWSIRLKK